MLLTEQSQNEKRNTNTLTHFLLPVFFFFKHAIASVKIAVSPPFLVTKLKVQ